jgi:hypothetical protein
MFVFADYVHASVVGQHLLSGAGVLKLMDTDIDLRGTTERRLIAGEYDICAIVPAERGKLGCSHASWGERIEDIGIVVRAT